MEKYMDFLRDIREGGFSYESVDESEFRNILGGWTGIGPFRKGNLYYDDAWRVPWPGFFEGRETISEFSTVKWYRNYKGRVGDIDYQGKEDLVYESILKPALRQFPRGEPFRRGPEDFRIIVDGREYLYEYALFGDASDFRDIEVIKLVNGNQKDQKMVYSFESRGGLASTGND